MAADGGLPATEAQIKAILAIGRGVRVWSDARTITWVQDRYGVALPALTRLQAAECIDALKLVTE